MNDFDPKLKFSSWIYRITHNEVISQFRKTKSRPQPVIAVDDAKIINRFSADIDFLKEIDQDYLAKDFGNLLAKMDSKYREVLVLRYMEDKSYDEISHILKKTNGSVGTLINRAKKKLKEKIIVSSKDKV